MMEVAQRRSKKMERTNVQLQVTGKIDCTSTTVYIHSSTKQSSGLDRAIGHCSLVRCIQDLELAPNIIVRLHGLIALIGLG